MFSGIGGFEYGIQNATQHIRRIRRGDKTVRHMSNAQDSSGRGTPPTCIGYSEIDKYASKVYERHYDHKNYGDATRINAKELPDFELLVGGFPCQAFSVAGKRAGFDDTRGTLFFDIARILKEKRPRHLVLENVKGLLSHDGGRTFTTIIGVLSDLGYCVEWQVLNSKNFGVPQNRERVFIVGHLGGECRRKIFPLTASDRKNNEVRYESKDTATSISDCKNWNESESERSNIRRLTPKECERLQGFPDDWTAGESDTQRYKMCGNAVTTNVVQAVMESLLYD